LLNSITRDSSCFSIRSITVIVVNDVLSCSFASRIFNNLNVDVLMFSFLLSFFLSLSLYAYGDPNDRSFLARFHVVRASFMLNGSIRYLTVMKEREREREKSSKIGTILF
jgi:hypothetical protein